MTLEAFLARKPVYDSDAGESLEFVEIAGSWWSAVPEALPAIAALAADRGLARRLGEAGHERARLITFRSGVSSKVVGDAGEIW